MNIIISYLHFHYIDSVLLLLVICYLLHFLNWRIMYLSFSFCKQYVYEVYKYSLEGANISFSFFKTKGAVC